MRAQLKEIGDHVEEQVSLFVNGIEVVCFASIVPYEIQLGRSYPVVFHIFVIDEYRLKKSSSIERGVERIDNGFRYRLRGRLVGNTIQCGLPFEDDFLVDEYGYLDGEQVELEVDRIDVEFI
ncbi:hypothetical protein PUV47_18950 [Pseudovibrio exalbescens]|uniref:hypothetical protein n=1 Tax=Pseudovibrio exalbescens TaxID=197461 RepID=UPI002365F0A4|nr:hypothetical protein [Pseudovibrio exalbescens]MDD7912015.1 hypothetical protein [Pseudovibrio exalbescens]